MCRQTKNLPWEGLTDLEPSMGRLSIGAGLVRLLRVLVGPTIFPTYRCGLLYAVKHNVVRAAQGPICEKEAVLPQDKGDDSKPVRCLGRTQVRFSTLPLPPVLLPSKLVTGGQGDGRYDQPPRASY